MSARSTAPPVAIASLWRRISLLTRYNAVGGRAFTRLVPPGTLRLAPGLPAAVAIRGLVTFAFFGTDGKPTLHKDGNAGYTARYDERGNQTEVTYLGLDGRPTVYKDGYARSTSRYEVAVPSARPAALSVTCQGWLPSPR